MIVLPGGGFFLRVYMRELLLVLIERISVEMSSPWRVDSASVRSWLESRCFCVAPACVIT